MSLHHVTVAVRGRQSLARTDQERRALVLAVVELCGPRLPLFCLVDDHFHGLLATEAPGYLAREVRRCFSLRRPDLRLKRPHLERVDTRAYLRWVFRYVLCQPAKHGVSDSAMWSGSCFQDLVSARLLSGFDRTVIGGELPRFRLREAFEWVGLAPEPLVPAGDEAIRRAGAARIRELAAGVFGVGPALRPQSRGTGETAARRLGVGVGLAVGLPTSELGHYFEMVTASIRRLARRGVDPDAERALRLRLTLEDRVLRARRAA